MDPLSVLSLFSGGGGLDLGTRLVGGFRTIAYVENDPYAQGVLMSNMRKGILDPAPIWDDVRTFDGASLRGRVDVVAGGFPCQDVSHAGKRAGLKEGTRSGLWSEFSRIIGEVRPRYVLVENVPGLLSGGFGRVLGDLARGGYDASWYCLAAAHVGAPHRRNRVWVIAYPQHTDTDKLGWDRAPIDFNGNAELRDKQECIAGSVREDVADANGRRLGWRKDNKQRQGISDKSERGRAGAQSEMADPAHQRHVWRDGQFSADEALRGARNHFFERTAWHDGRKWWSTEPNVGRVAHGVAFRVDRLRCLGNGVVPQQSVPAWNRVREMSEV